MGYTKKVAYEKANEIGANIIELKTKEKTDGTLGFWWCGRFGMHQWKMDIDNINIDLIYAAYDDINILKSDIDCFLELDIPHISTYSLIIEDNTVLKINNTKNIDEDLDYGMYNYIQDTLEKNGYIHYEISNYARSGYQSKHNLGYWNNYEYYGFGLSSVSYIGNKRISNTKNLSKYLSGSYLDYTQEEDKDIQMENEVMLGLRKFDGINLDEFKKMSDVIVVNRIDDNINDVKDIVYTRDVFSRD